MTLLSLSGMAKSYAGVPALIDAALELRPGEVHALMGENGAGKSTLIKILAGVVKADAGDIRIAGAAATIAAPADAIALGLRFIHQELAVVPHLSVAENLFLGHDYPRRFGFMVDWGAINRAAGAALSGLGIDHIPPGRKMARLSVGDQMLVKIAAAFLDRGTQPARIYVMDEPTAALNGEESARLFKVIAALKARGCGIIYVSHRMDEVMALADRVTVMRDGRSVATREIAGVSMAEIIELMIGRRFDDSYPRRSVPVGEEEALRVEGLSSPVLKSVSFRLRKGEILGLAGLAGAGQSELLRCLMGADPGEGAVYLEGAPIARDEPAFMWSYGLALVPRERRREGLILDRSVADNTTLPHLAALSRLGVILDRKKEMQESRALADRVRLKSTGPKQKVRELSGGNQQKVVFARAIAGGPSVLLLDEPTRGVDVGARFDIHSLLRELTAAGLSVILASSDLAELLGMCDRLLVMRDGAVIGDVLPEGLDEQALLALCYASP